MKKSLLAAFLLGCALMTGVSAQAPGMLQEKVYDTGKPIKKPMVMLPYTEFQHARKTPDLVMYDLEGKRVNLSEYKGKVLVVNVWATWCEPCLREIPALIEIQKKIKGTNLALVGLSVDTNPKDVIPFMKRHKLEEFHTWIDSEQDIDRLMPLTVVPTNYVFDGSGNLVGFLRGYLPWEDPEALEYLKKIANKYADK